MDENTKAILTHLYLRKGELTTELEIMQAQLQNVNQQIVQIRNRQIQQPEKKIKDEKKKK